MKRNKIVQLFFVLGMLLAVTHADAQSYWFGVRGGGTIGLQQWSRYQRQPLLASHVGVFIETPDEDKESGSLYASLGLHQRGSSIRSFYNTIQNIQISGISFVFNNISLQVGAKKFINKQFYYSVGIRGEYTAFTNLSALQERYNSAFFPLEDFVRPFTAGISGAGGYQFDIGELYGVSVELSVSPDFFNQYVAPSIGNIISPVTGQPVNIPATEIRNTSVELTVAMRFLRKVEYY